MKTKRRYIIKQMFKKKSLCWGMGSMNTKAKIKEGFYWLKLMICLLLNLKRDDDALFENIPMLTYDGRGRNSEIEYYYEWNEVGVGSGLFKRWWYNEYLNGT
jgi:hypothetical protein